MMNEEFIERLKARERDRTSYASAVAAVGDLEAKVDGAEAEGISDGLAEEWREARDEDEFIRIHRVLPPPEAVREPEVWKTPWWRGPWDSWIDQMKRDRRNGRTGEFWIDFVMGVTLFLALLALVVLAVFLILQLITAVTWWGALITGAVVAAITGFGRFVWHATKP